MNLGKIVKTEEVKKHIKSNPEFCRDVSGALLLMGLNAINGKFDDRLRNNEICRKHPTVLGNIAITISPDKNQTVISMA